MKVNLRQRCVFHTNVLVGLSVRGAMYRLNSLSSASPGFCGNFSPITSLEILMQTEVTMQIPRTLPATAVLSCLVATAGFTQTPLYACESQQSLEQVIGSNADIMPDDCRQAQISQLTADGYSICLLDLSQSSGGLINDLRDVAVSQEWWIDCALLSAQADPTD
jgi:hypothetical protein